MALNKQLKYIWNFIEKNNLLIEKKQITLALSGGVDSQVLAHIFKKFEEEGFVENVSALHIHHQTREESEHKKDINVIKKIFPNVLVEKIKIDKKTETNLRIEREKIYSNLYHKKNSIIVSAHHLDDSFEWSMMNFFKSSSLKSIIGIPLVNKFKRRPLMCLSKDQILKYAKENKIPFNEDKTNSNLNVERNYFRSEILPGIKRKYPNYLEHYIRRSNKLLSEMNDKNVQIIEKKNYHIYFIENDLSLLKHKITDSIIHFSSKLRGELGKEIDKLIKAIENKKTGPMNFSGGVKIYIFKTFILVTNNFENLFLSVKKTRQMNYFQFKNYAEHLNYHSLKHLIIGYDELPFPVKLPHRIKHNSKSKIILVEVKHLLNTWSKQGKYKSKQINFVEFS